ncbi:uncharacterized protein [Paralichthys olivaceus]|uniref:uncharacterized protein n=1 Tax=Paralichthys olivaceus TaxID=8255 RepID=UPI0037538096
MPATHAGIVYRWCHPRHVTVKQRVCSLDIELVAVGLRPYYLPREFTSVFAITVYIPPSGNAEAACDVIHTVTAGLQRQHPGAFIVITGDFNHASLSSTLPTFFQFVKCATCENKTLDLLYANVKDAYSSTALPPLGRSDHNLVLLSPSYKPVVQRHPVKVRTVRKWSPEAMESLRGALEATHWDALYEPHGEDIDGLTDCVSEYIGFCIDNTIPTKEVRCLGLSRLYFLRGLGSFNVCNKMLQMFYQSVVVSTIFFAVVSWGVGIKTKDANRLSKISRKAESVVGYIVLSFVLNTVSGLIHIGWN